MLSWPQAITIGERVVTVLTHFMISMPNCQRAPRPAFFPFLFLFLSHSAVERVVAGDEIAKGLVVQKEGEHALAPSSGSTLPISPRRADSFGANLERAQQSRGPAGWDDSQAKAVHDGWLRCSISCEYERGLN